MALPVVAIVGRPNVGKSSLFNRILGRRRAIVEPEPGVTRDVVEAEAEWAGVRFRLADTGGLFPPSPADELAGAVARKAEAAVAEAAVVLFVVDAQVGLTGADELVADRLRRLCRAVVLVANKADSERARHAAAEFARLGFGEAFAVSALHGLGVGELLDEVARRLAESGSGGIEGGEPAGSPPRVAVVGR
ncbi:MAG: 50S ribosome-binding GTPase, partial [Clostridia bacterium]|nr:50S ribosome-binding GTPase [Clostridia bacterium]